MLLHFKEQIRMIDTPQLHEKAVHLKKKECILFNSDHLFKIVTFWIIRQHEWEAYEKSVYYYDEFVKKKKKKLKLKL